MKKLLNWFDRNILTIFSFFLIAFIPLYPKLPLLELIPGYIVRVRLEDFFILAAFLIFLIQVFRKKAVFKSIIFWPMVIYLIVGFLSIPSGIFITRTIPLSKLHILKAFLHWLRRIEYFSVFFVFYNGIKDLKKLKTLAFLLILILALIVVYGYGQRRFYWPVYSTMNREFSKGMKLYLTEHARVPSTFGGHYDLAAFLVIFLTLFASFFLVLRKKVKRYLFLGIFILSYFLLMLTASRTSFIAYLGAITILLLILSFKQGKLWAFSRWLLFIFFSFLIMVFFGDLSDRFAHFLKMPEVREKLKLNTLLKPLRPAPKQAVRINDDVLLVMDKSDERPITEKPKNNNQEKRKELPPGVFKDIPDYVLESTFSATSTSGKKRLATGAARLKPVSRTFSENAYRYGLSTAIRLDSLWPWAIEGFKKDPLFGSGYSTLTKSSIVEFTEAESTDNDYLRILGETGLFGFISFFSIIFLLIKNSLTVLKSEIDPFIFAFTAGFVAFTFGLLINALYIDVFEASKVAFIFWALAGILLAFSKKARLKLGKRNV